MAKTVGEFLTEHELGQYQAAFDTAGWDSLSQLRSISERTALGIASLHEVLAARPPGAGSRDALPSLTA